jgi:hypothetical protein
MDEQKKFVWVLDAILLETYLPLKVGLDGLSIISHNVFQGLAPVNIKLNDLKNGTIKKRTFLLFE